MAIAERRLLGVDFPPVNTERLLPPPEIFTHGSGIDLAYPYPDGKRPKNYRYEDRCFREITSSPQDRDLFVGPYALDKFFSEELAILVRPDAIRFLKDSGGELVLTHLFEFRSGELDFQRKIRGFELFLQRIRKDGHLMRLFEWLKGDRVSTVVPPTREISVVFVSPSSREDTVFEHSVFRRVTHLRIPKD